MNASDFRRIHGHGFVRLDASLADDLSVVNAARVSFGKKKAHLDESDEGLISFLMRERHGTPFEHNALRFHVRCPIFVAREWFRHRIGSFNEYSGRYSEMPLDGYVPDESYVRTQVGKPGSYRFESMSASESADACALIERSYALSFATYEQLLKNGVAKEIARIVLPVGNFTEFYWTVNARSLMNFLSLRTDETAMREIRDYALSVEKLFADVMPVTYKAFVGNGKIAP